MAKIKVEDLEKIREKVRATIVLREGGPYKAKVTVHMGTCGIASGARKIMTALLKEVEGKGVKDVLVSTSGCAGLCSRERFQSVPSSVESLHPSGSLVSSLHAEPAGS